jgi:hypothetical protein
MYAEAKAARAHAGAGLRCALVRPPADFLRRCDGVRKALVRGCMARGRVGQDERERGAGPGMRARGSTLRNAAHRGRVDEPNKESTTQQPAAI